MCVWAVLKWLIEATTLGASRNAAACVCVWIESVRAYCSPVTALPLLLLLLPPPLYNGLTCTHRVEYFGAEANGKWRILMDHFSGIGRGRRGPSHFKAKEFVLIWWCVVPFFSLFSFTWSTAFQSRPLLKYFFFLLFSCLFFNESRYYMLCSFSLFFILQSYRLGPIRARYPRDCAMYCCLFSFYFMSSKSSLSFERDPIVKVARCSSL